MESILHKTFMSKVQDVDTTAGVVINYDSAFNKLDSDGDIARPGCYTKTLSENIGRMKWFLNHDSRILLGVPFIEGTTQDEFGLLSYNRINMDKEVGRDTLSDYKLFKEYGRTLEHSIGYTVKQAKPLDLGDGKMGRELLEVKLWEKSTLTSWGANEWTPLVDIKSAASIKSALEILNKMFTADMTYSDKRKREAEALIKQLESLSGREPDNTTSDDEPAIKEILESILTTFKTK